MAQLSLIRLLKKNKQAYGVVREIAEALAGELVVFDDLGAVLVGQGVFPEKGARTAVSLNGQTMGWVAGPLEGCTVLANLLENLLATEAEKRDLSEEVLDNYRELNLLYNLSERLISTPEPPAIANMALKEADRLVHLSAAWIFLVDNDDRIIPIAKRGRPLAFNRSTDSEDDLIGAVLASGQAEIRNNVPLHSFFTRMILLRVTSFAPH